MYDICIIGAGVVGSFVSRELSKYKLKVLILEKNSDVCSEVSKANSAIFHSGYNNKPKTIKAKYCTRAHEIIDEICSDLDVEYKKTGSLLVSLNDIGKDSIYEKYKNGVKNKVPGIKILEKKEILELEPNISDQATLALYAPTTGVINPFEMTIAACENAIENGVSLKLNSEVIGISKQKLKDFDSEALFEIKCKDKSKYYSKILINCAGIHTDKINNMISNDKFFEVAPKKGEYIVLDKLEGEIVNNVVFMTKDPDDKKNRGIIVTPTTSGNILLGPSAEDTKENDSVFTTKEKLDFIQNSAKKICPSINLDNIITYFAGFRPNANLFIKNKDTGEIEKEKSKDFIVKQSSDVKGLINVAGIKSPGLTCAPAIAEDVANMVVEILGQVEKNESFNPKRKKVVKFKNLDEASRNELIKSNKSYGNIICNCEMITEGEILDAIHRKCGATTLDGLKKRTRIGMGRCQGNFCTLKALEIMSRELKIPIEKLQKSNQGSEFFVEE